MWVPRFHGSLAETGISQLPVSKMKNACTPNSPWAVRCLFQSPCGLSRRNFEWHVWQQELSDDEHAIHPVGCIWQKWSHLSGFSKLIDRCNHRCCLNCFFRLFWPILVAWDRRFYHCIRCRYNDRTLCGWCMLLFNMNSIAKIVVIVTLRWWHDIFWVFQLRGESQFPGMQLSGRRQMISLINN